MHLKQRWLLLPANHHICWKRNSFGERIRKKLCGVRKGGISLGCLQLCPFKIHKIIGDMFPWKLLNHCRRDIAFLKQWRGLKQLELFWNDCLLKQDRHSFFKHAHGSDHYCTHSLKQKTWQELIFVFIFHRAWDNLVQGAAAAVVWIYSWHIYGRAGKYHLCFAYEPKKMEWCSQGHTGSLWQRQKLNAAFPNPDPVP